MNIRSDNKIWNVMIVVFFVAVFLSFSRPVLLGDFWWHINTGRWIVENRALPDTEPFLYTVEGTPDARQEVILKGYWFAQAAYYLIYQAAGFKGVIIFKSLGFLLIFVFLYFYLRRRGLSPPLALLLFVNTVAILLPYEEIRPHILAALCSVLVYIAADEGIRALGTGDVKRTPRIFLLIPVVMLIWSNMHRGYYVGHVILVVCLVAEGMTMLMKRDGALTLRAYGTLALWSFIGMLSAVLNPNNISSIIVTTRELVSSPFTDYVIEYLPPWKYAAVKGESRFVGLLFLLITLTAAPLLISFRRVSFRHAMLYAGFLVMALKSFRFGIFFAPLSVAITAEYLAMRTNRLHPAFMKAATAAALVAVISVAVLFSPKSVFFRKSDFEGVIPYKSMDFVKRYKPKGPIFNPYTWGGYIGWALYPDYRVFVDPRCMDYSVLLENEEIMKGDLASLDRYGINTVITYPLWFFRSDKYIPELNLRILADDRWQLFYFDGVSVIYTRKGTAPRGPGFGKGMVWNYYKERLNAWMSDSPADYRPYAFMGKVLLSTGDPRGAVEYFGRAERLLPPGAAPEWLFIKRSLERQSPQR